jgi:hypothetical protein
MKIGYKMAFLSFLFIVFASCESEKPNEQNETVEILPENKLPQVNINTNGAQIVDEPKIEAQMEIKENDIVDFSGKIGIEIRGSSSQMFPKKQFGLETWDDANDGINVSLLGFPEEEDWILYAPYSDKALIRNALIYDLSRDIGRYASRLKFVDVSINGTYNGVYVLLEKLKRDSNRIDINNLRENEISGEDLTGGYILKIDKADGPNETTYTATTAITSNYAPNNATSGQKIYFLYDTPDSEDILTEQRDYITNYMHDFEDALAGDNFTDPEMGYAKYINSESFIDFFLLNELSNNVDGFRLSTWLTKDKNEKLNMGPIWDFNLAFGNANYCGGGDTNVWAYKFNSRCSGDFWEIPFWWDRLMQDPAFVTSLQNRWLELRGGVFSNGSIMAKIDAYVETLTLAGVIQDNFAKWPVLGQYVWPNNFVGNSYTEEIDYLKGWVNNRLNWLDNAIMGL